MNLSPKWTGVRKGSIVPGGDADATGALTLALAQKPSLVYLITDGELPDGAALLSRARRARDDPEAR